MDGLVAQRMRAQRVWGSDLATPGAVVRHLVAVQAQEHRYARWSVAQRMKRPGTATAIDAAFDDGAFVRTHVLRPTRSRRRSSSTATASSPPRSSTSHT